MESTLRLRGGVLYFFVTGILYFLQVDQSLVFRSVCVVSHSSKRLRFCWFGFGFLAFLESSKFDLVNTLFHCSKLTLCRETFKLPNRFLCLELVPTFSIIRINNNNNNYRDKYNCRKWQCHSRHSPSNICSKLDHVQFVERVSSILKHLFCTLFADKLFIQFTVLASQDDIPRPPTYYVMYDNQEKNIKSIQKLVVSSVPAPGQ